MANKRQKQSYAGFYQEAVIANPKNLRRQLKLRFLVDTGSTGTVIPAEVAKQLKLECVGQGLVELADGSKVKTKLAYIYMRINSEHVFTLCSYNGCAGALLGFDVMHVLGLQVDTEKKRLLKPIRLFSLKEFILRKRWINSRRRNDG
jgi:clan AA aspartic protease